MDTNCIVNSETHTYEFDISTDSQLANRRNWAYYNSETGNIVIQPWLVPDGEISIEGSTFNILTFELKYTSYVYTRMNSETTVNLVFDEVMSCMYTTLSTTLETSTLTLDSILLDSPDVSISIDSLGASQPGNCGEFSYEMTDNIRDDGTFIMYISEQSIIVPNTVSCDHSGTYSVPVLIGLTDWPVSVD